MGAVLGCNSIINSTSLSGGIPGNSSGKTSGYSHTTGISSNLIPSIAYTQELIDEDIATNDTSTLTPVSTSTTPLGPITRARARWLTHQVSSLLSSGSSYLENGDTCTLVLLRNHGLDQKGRGIAQAGFGLQDRHDL
jgi:hypothetical protein